MWTDLYSRLKIGSKLSSNQLNGQPTNLDARHECGQCFANDADGPALIAGLKSGYFVRFPFTVVSEIIATSCGVRRKELLQVCRTLLRSAGDCIEPHHEIIRIMVSRFENSLPLDLASVNLRMDEAERKILLGETFDEGLADQEREETRANNKVFVGVYANAKTAFDELATKGIAMPRTAGELVSLLQAGGTFWNSGSQPLRAGCYGSPRLTETSSYFTDCANHSAYC